MTDTIDTLLAALGVLGQIAIVVILVAGAAALVSPRAREALLGSWSALQRQALWAAWLVAAVATGGSLYFSEIAGYIPCQLCWYQRICMYPLSITLLAGAILRDRRAVLYSMVFPLVGAFVSIRHIYIENNPEAESASCRIGAPCSAKYIDEFGYVTIPTLALTAFVLIGLLLGIAWLAARRGDAAARAAQAGATRRPDPHPARLAGTRLDHQQASGAPARGTSRVSRRGDPLRDVLRRRRGMSIGFGLFLVAVGAILRWGVTRGVEGANLDVIGLILIVIGAAVAVIGFLMSGTFRRSRTVERSEVTPRGHERVVEEDRRL